MATEDTYRTQSQFRGTVTPTTLAADIAASIENFPVVDTALATKLANPTSDAARAVAYIAETIIPSSLGAIPTVMSSPPAAPTQSAGNPSSSQISGGIDYLYTDPKFSYLGARPVVETLSTGIHNYYRVEDWTGSITGTNFVGQATWTIGFAVTSRYLELILCARQSYGYMMFVDGKRVSVADITNPSAGSTQYRHLFDFSTEAYRVIELELPGWMLFRGIALESTGQMHPDPKPRGPLVAFLTDSFGDSAADFTKTQSWCANLRWLMGWRDVYRLNQGATGYLDAATFGKRAYPDRVVDIHPDTQFVFVQGSTNDEAEHAADSSLLTPVAAATYAAIRARAPRARLIVIPAFELGQTGGNPAQTNIMNLREAVVSAASGVADMIIDPIGDSLAGDYWFRGTGRVGTTTGNGPADVARYSDNLHPTYRGSLDVAYKIGGRLIVNRDSLLT